MQKTQNYYNSKALIDKAYHKKTAYKIQFYNNNKVDEMVKNWNDGGVSSKPAPAMLQAELSILNKPEVYKNYNRIINSKFTSNDNFFKMLVRNKAQSSLDGIVKNEVERISKNLNYVEQVLKKYEIPTKEYQKLVNQQADKSIANRQKILNEVAIKSNDLLVSEGINIPSAYSYINLETSAQSMLRQSQMTADWEEAQAINQNYIDEGKNALYNSKVWIHTHGGATTRHMSNHMQRVRFDEPFIVVNDNTLEIDEMMYPCDPAGSPSNAYICYCEVEYENDESYELDTPNINVTNWKPEVNFKNGLTVDLNTPKAPSVVSLDIQGLMNSYVKEPAKPLDINSLEAGLIDGEYKLPSKDYFDLMETTGSELNSKGEIVPIATEEAIKEYNKQFQPETTTGSYIDVTKYSDADFTYSEATGNYLIDLPLLTKNEITGKWELNGLEMDSVNDIFGKVSKEKLDAHNSQFAEGKTTVGGEMKLPETQTTDALTGEKVNTKAEIIDLSKFEDGKLLVDKEYDGVYYNETNGHWEYKGLEVIDYSEKWDIGTIYLEDAKAHNEKLSGNTVEPKGEVIDIDVIPYMEASNQYMVLKSKLDYNADTGKTYYKGLDVSGYLSPTGSAYIPAEAIINHNSKLGASTYLKPENKEILKPNKEKPIDTSNFEKLGDDFFIEFNGKEELDALGVTYNESTGEYELKGLEINKLIGDPEGHGAIEIPIDYIEDYNNKLGYDLNGNKLPTKNLNTKPEGSRTHIRNSEIIRREKENTGETYAIDENGTKYRIDKNRKSEREQDRLQMKIDMSEHKTGMYGWALPRYRKLNNLILGKYEYSSYKTVMKGEVLPLLDEIYRRVDENKSINDLLGKYEKVADKLIKKSDDSLMETLLWDLVDMEQALAKSPALTENVMFIRDGFWDEVWNQVGGIFEFEPYQSTTYNEHGAGFDADYKYRITILAPEGTRGTRMNEQYDSLTGEHEWLLKRNQKFEVLEFNDSPVHDAELGQDYKGTVTIRLIPD